MKALILTIIELNLVRKGLSFLLDCHIYGTLRFKEFLVPFIDSSSRPEEFLKISQNQLQNT